MHHYMIAMNVSSGRRKPRSASSSLIHTNSKNSSSDRNKDRQLFQNIFRYAISCIAQSRSIVRKEEMNFEKSMFHGTALPILTAIDEFVSVPSTSSKGYLIAQWMENGVLEAVGKGQLQTFSIFVMTERESMKSQAKKQILEEFEFRLGRIHEKRWRTMTKPLSEQIEYFFQKLSDRLSSSDGPDYSTSHIKKKTNNNNTYRFFSFAIGMEDGADTVPPRFYKTHHKEINTASSVKRFIGRVVTNQETCVELWHLQDVTPDENLVRSLFGTTVLPESGERILHARDENTESSANRNVTLVKNTPQMKRSGSKNIGDQSTFMYQKAAWTDELTPKSSRKYNKRRPYEMWPLTQRNTPLPSPVIRKELSSSSVDADSENSRMLPLFSPIPQRQIRLLPLTSKTSGGTLRSDRRRQHSWKDISPGEVSEVPTVIADTPILFHSHSVTMPLRKNTNT